MSEWGPTVDSVVVVEEYMTLVGHIWDYGAGVVDVGMTEEFSTYFMAHIVARISDPAEMLPAFDDDEDEHPERKEGVRQRDEEGEEVADRDGDDGGGGGGGDRGGGGRDGG